VLLLPGNEIGCWVGVVHCTGLVGGGEVQIPSPRREARHSAGFSYWLLAPSHWPAPDRCSVRGVTRRAHRSPGQEPRANGQRPKANGQRPPAPQPNNSHPPPTITATMPTTTPSNPQGIRNGKRGSTTPRESQWTWTEPRRRFRSSTKRSRRSPPGAVASTWCMVFDPCGRVAITVP